METGVIAVRYARALLKSATEVYYGWDPGNVRLIASIMLFAFCVGNFGGGALNDRFGPIPEEVSSLLALA